MNASNTPVYTEEQKAQMIGPIIQTLETRTELIRQKRAILKAEGLEMQEYLDSLYERCAELSKEECQEFLDLSDELDELCEQLDTLKAKLKKTTRRLKHARAYKDRISTPADDEEVKQAPKKRQKKEKAQQPDQSDDVAQLTQKIALLSIASSVEQPEEVKEKPKRQRKPKTEKPQEEPSQDTVQEQEPVSTQSTEEVKEKPKRQRKPKTEKPQEEPSQDTAQEQESINTSSNGDYKWECPVCHEKFKINRHNKCGKVAMIKLD